ncbi:hypothetical protein HRbin39_01163 [bacterium HR39]|nr:hypothetical protein HRbin39_01163 [bacterium HR39]
MIRIERRPRPSRLFLWLGPPLAVAAATLCGLAIFALLVPEPLAALRAFFLTPLSSLYGLGELGVKAAPLVLIATGLSLGFRAGVWNIGAEGQLVLGAIAAGLVALATWGREGAWIFPACLVAGAAAGALWAAIPAFLRVRLGVSEILVSLMLVYVAELLLAALVYGPLKDPEGFGFPHSRLFTEAALAPTILPGTRLHPGAVAALLAVLAAWVFAARTLPGYALLVSGLAPRAARHAGFPEGAAVWGTLLAGGALAGLAGAFEVTGPIGQLVPDVSPGYGFTAIIVAFLGRLHPLGVLLAGLLVALSYIGGEQAQIEAGLPQAVTGVFQGLLLFWLLAVDVFVHYRPKVVGPRLRRAA